MTEQRKSDPLDDASALPPDPPPGSDPEPVPRYPKGQGKREARPETLADNTKVTPLDPDKNLEDGIEVNET